MLALIEHPEQLAILRGSRCWRARLKKSCGGARSPCTSPNGTRRHGTRGKPHPEGDKVLLWFISGDYDERQFRDPFRFDIRRSPNDHPRLA